jgi:hypothetical protein
MSNLAEAQQMYRRIQWRQDRQGVSLLLRALFRRGGWNMRVIHKERGRRFHSRPLVLGGDV